MKALAGIAVAAGLFLAASPQAFALHRFAAPSAGARSDMAATDFSARKKRAVVVTPAAPVVAAPGYRAWTGADPTKGPGIEQLREYQREYRCVIDEGYGRYTFCSNM
ncbi:MAG: hypothetical protein ACXWKC_03130 [Xanthobacteraceae bacterium]